MTVPRVLIVSHTYAAPINRAKLDALAQHVALTALIPGRWRDALFDLTHAPVEPARYTLHRLPIRFDGHILRYFFPLRPLFRIVRQAKPDLVYIEEEPASLALTQFAFLKRRFRYRLAFFTWENIARRIGMPGVEQYNLRRCDGAITGNAQAASVIRAKGFRGPICVTPQLGIDPQAFHPERAIDLRRELGLTSFVVGYIGRLVEEKGLHLLLDVARSLPNIQLLIIGNGPLRADIESMAHDRVRLIDAMSHERIAHYLNALDALVLPSLTTPTWKEQFGHVLIEAMACGVPVIGSDSGAIPEVIGDVGIIVHEGDIAALRRAITELAADPDRRTLLAQAGRNRVLAHYTHNRIAAENVDFFVEVMRP